jgi:thymidine phosphorylase
MQARAEAVTLAQLMVSIGEAVGKRTAAFVTSMEEPLGAAIGNALEIAEAIAVLRDESRREDLRDVCLLLGAAIMVMAGKAHSLEQGKDILAENIANRAAVEKLQEMITAQGGDARVVDDPSLLPQADEVIGVPSPADGYVCSIDARRVGLVAMELGAGRKTKGEPVDHAVGVVLERHVGDRVESGQCLAWIHTNHRIPTAEAIRATLESFVIGAAPPRREPHVLEMIPGRVAWGRYTT